MKNAFQDRPAGTRHRLRTPDGVELEVREFGDPDGIELLLVTGVAQSYLSFVRQFSDPALQHLRIIAYDPRGPESLSARSGTVDGAGPTRCEPSSKEWD